MTLTVVLLIGYLNLQMTQIGWHSLQCGGNRTIPFRYQKTVIGQWIGKCGLTLTRVRPYILDTQMQELSIYQEIKWLQLMRKKRTWRLSFIRH